MKKLLFIITMVLTSIQMQAQSYMYVHEVETGKEYSLYTNDDVHFVCFSHNLYEEPIDRLGTFIIVGKDQAFGCNDHSDVIEYKKPYRCESMLLEEATAKGMRLSETILSLKDAPYPYAGPFIIKFNLQDKEIVVQDYLDIVHTTCQFLPDNGKINYNTEGIAVQFDFDVFRNNGYGYMPVYFNFDMHWQYKGEGFSCIYGILPVFDEEIMETVINEGAHLHIPDYGLVTKAMEAVVIDNNETDYYWTFDTTGISDIQHTSSSNVQIFTTSGALTNGDTNKEPLPHGIYIMRHKGKTKKVKL